MSRSILWVRDDTIYRAYHLIQQHRFHFHQMTALGEAAFVDVGDVFAEGGEAFLLEAAVFGGEVGSPKDTGPHLSRTPPPRR